MRWRLAIGESGTSMREYGMVSSRMVASGTGEGWGEVLDTRLVAAVQAAAGARCHEAASLVQAYYFSAEACRRCGAAGEARRRRMVAAKVRLRDFLAERVLGWVGNGSAEGWVNVDRGRRRGGVWWRRFREGTGVGRVKVGELRGEFFWDGKSWENLGNRWGSARRRRERGGGPKRVARGGVVAICYFL